MQSYNHIHFGQAAAHLKQSFNELSPDPWLKEEDDVFRFRSYQKAVVSRLRSYYLQSDNHFYQPAYLNQYSGGIYRKYPELRADIADTILTLIIEKLLPFIPDMLYSVGVHQIRITTRDRSPGYPAPEGIHQDGFSYIAIYCVGASNFTGGETTLIPCHDNRNAPVTFKLKEGDAVIFNDINYQHYTSAIMPLLPGNGYRDVFVITFDRAQESG